MYTQKYPEGDSSVRLPDNYSGNAILQNERISIGSADVKKPSVEFSQNAREEQDEVREENKNPWEDEEERTEAVATSAGQRSSPFGRFKGLGGFFDGLPIRRFFEKRGGGGDLFASLGIEEIMLIALAAMLFFSKNGDKECALILLLLLFVD